MTAFLSTLPATGTRFRPVASSPLERALAGAPEGLTDLSLALAKFEVRGDLGRVTAGDVIPIAPTRALVVCDSADAEEVADALRGHAASVLDRTGALAALRIDRPDAATIVRRLTDLDLEALPAAGAVARVRTLVRGGGTRFDLFFPQEYGHYLAGVVVDTARGLEA